MIYIGIPTFDGKLHHTTSGGLFNLSYLMGRQNIPVCVDAIPHDCYIGHARDLSARRFLAIPDATDLVFVDSDVGFDYTDFDALMSADVDIVCGIYPYKQDAESYPAAPAQPIERRGKLVRLIYGPTGFMRIRRKVFEKLIETVPSYIDQRHGSMHQFFPFGRDDFLFRGEDTWFCRLAAAAGFKIWGIEGLKLKHTGTKTWEGEWESHKPHEAQLVTKRAA